MASPTPPALQDYRFQRRLVAIAMKTLSSHTENMCPTIPVLNNRIIPANEIELKSVIIFVHAKLDGAPAFDRKNIGQVMIKLSTPDRTTKTDPTANICAALWTLT